MTCEECIDNKMSVFSVLTPEQKETLKKANSSQNFKKGEIIFKEGDKPTGLLWISEGKVKIFNEGVGGREQIVRMAKPVGFIGYRALFAEENHTATAVAIEDCVSCVVDKESVFRVMRSNADLSMSVIQSFASELGFSHDRTVTLTQKHIRGRLAESLIFLKDTYGYEDDNTTIKIYLSREDVANLSNMTTSNAIRTLSTFAQEGVIAIDGRKIRILDLVWLLHLLPEWFLFRISDLLYFLMYHVAGYRKKVVADNLRMAFPECDPARIKSISRKFYHHFSDLILESGICHFYSESKALRRIKYRNPELLNDLYSKGKMVMAVTGHYGNWEYLNTLALASDYPVAAIYKPLNIKQIDGMIKRNRTRFGVMVYPMEKISRKLIDHFQKKDPVMTIFLADQRPLLKNVQYWTKFMGLDTPLYLGTEKLARKLDAAVGFLKIHKVKRGRDEGEVELVCENPNELDSYEITNRHVHILEKLITEEPQYWLWSHRRWKHRLEDFKEIKANET